MRILGRDIVWRNDPPTEQRTSLALPFQEYVNWFTYQGVHYPYQTLQTTLGGNKEQVGAGYTNLTESAFLANSVVATCITARLMHFAQARFQFQDISQGRPGKLFGTADLAILENPWPGAVTGDLLARMELDASLAGNFYATVVAGRLFRLRPDWVTIVLGSRRNRSEWIPGELDTEIAAYRYKPGGRGSKAPDILLRPDQVVHYMPQPDPQFEFRGMSWLTPVIREIQGDSLMTNHKNRFLEQGATVNLVVKVPATTVDSFNQWVATIREGHEGVANAYKTLFLAGGADATAIGADMQQMDFANVQGKGETRIAAAARVPTVIAGFSEGLQGSSLNEGNYRAAARQFADGPIRYLWGNAAASLQQIITIPGGARLWYDDRDIPFLKEDIEAAANVQNQQANSIVVLTRDAGFTPDSAVVAITSGDLTKLEHSGLISVQQQPPGAGNNGSSNGTVALPPGGVTQ